MGGPAQAVTAVDKARGALLGTFVGDALGMPFEGCAHTEVPEAVEMVAARRGLGTYTDDTQMMIALAESLIEQGRIDERSLARAFMEAYDPDRGYGGGTRRVIELWASGTPVMCGATQIFDGQGSRGNGAAMRIAPVAVAFQDDRPRLLREAARSAQITHAHPVGIDGAVVQAAAIGAALRGGDILAAAHEAARTPEMTAGLRELEDHLLADRPDPAGVRARFGCSSDARESVCVAIYAALAHGEFESGVCFAVRLGGDTDTIAAMTGAICAARAGATSIPARWLAALENGERGRTHVEELAAQLLASITR